MCKLAARGAIIPGEDHLDSRTVIWAGGGAAPALGRTLAERTKAETDRGGRITVFFDGAIEYLTFNRGARLITVRR